MNAADVTASTDHALAELVERYTARLQAGEPVDLESLVAAHPEHAERLRRLLPALQALAALERTASHGGPAVPAADGGLESGVLGDFRILGEVGRGGMGVVYEAGQISLGRKVALKVLPFASTLDPRHLQRFKNEAQAAAHLHHTNIVPVFAVGCERGVHYYAMQFIDGHTVAALIRALRQAAVRPTAAEPLTAPYLPSDPAAPAAPATTASAPPTPFPAAFSTERSAQSPAYFRNVAQLGVQAAEALDHAHQMGVLHRDVKPANLMVEATGHLWVTDFGLARFQADANLTLSGDLVGTLRYMSPEQALAQRGVVDHRTDVYSLGATLYELLTHEPAVPGEDRHEIVRRIAEEEPVPPRRHNKVIPAELEVVVLKAMAKNPAERYATAQELADDLRRFLDDKPVRARRTPLRQRLARWARRHKAWVAAAAAVLVLATAALAVSNVLVWRERQRAEKRSEFARRVVNDMYTDFAEKWLADEAEMEEVQREFLLKALGFYEELAREGGSDPGVRLETAKAYRRVGDIQAKLHDYDKAGEAYDKAVALLTRLAADRPGEPTDRQELALAHNNRGKLLRQTGRASDAAEDWQRALDLREELVRQHPGEPAYRRDLAGSYNNRAIRLVEVGKRADAEQSYRQALAAWADLAREYPDEPEYRFDVSRSYSNLGLLLAASGRSEGAEETFDQAADRRRKAEEAFAKAVALLQDLVKAHPRAAAYRQALAHGHYIRGRLASEDALALQLGLPGLCAGPGRQGAVLTAATRSRTAEEAFQQALELQRKLVEDFPRVPSYRHELAKSWDSLGRRLEQTGRHDEAQFAFRQSLPHWNRLTQRYPDDASYRQSQSRGLAGLGDQLRMEAFTLERDMSAPASGDSRAKFGFPVTDGGPGRFRPRPFVPDDPLQPQTATDAYGQARKLNEQLVKAHPDRADYRDDLAETYHKLARQYVPSTPQLRDISAGDRKKANELLRQAIGQREAARKLKPKDAGYRHRLAEDYLALAENLARLAEPAEATRAVAAVRDRADDWQQHYRAALVLARCLPLAEGPVGPPERERMELAARCAGQAREHLRLAAKLCPDYDKGQNSLVWTLANHVDARLRDPALALAAARKAVAQDARSALYRNALALALYRSGEWQACLDVVEGSVKLVKSPSGAHHLLRAMSHWHLGNQEDADGHFDRAVKWVKANGYENNATYRRLIDEAAALLGRTPPPK
jgi:serine/threonine protein kinase